MSDYSKNYWLKAMASFEINIAGYFLKKRKDLSDLIEVIEDIYKGLIVFQMYLLHTTA